MFLLDGETSLKGQPALNAWDLSCTNNGGVANLRLSDCILWGVAAKKVGSIFLWGLKESDMHIASNA